MLVEFTVGNYTSFREPVTLSLMASKKVSEYRDSNVITSERLPLLKSAVVYGANAGGKSNLMSSLVWMRWFVINSSKDSQAGESINVKPFKLDVDFPQKPSRFEIVFFLNSIRYRYGFEADQKQVIREWLYKATKNAEAQMFLRVGEDIEVSRNFQEGKGIESKTRNNVLFLSLAASMNGQLSGEIIRWFSSLTPFHGLRDGQYATAVEMLGEEAAHKQFIQMIHNADLCIEDVLVEEQPLDPSPVLKLLSEEGKKKFLQDMAEAKSISLRTIHKRFKDGQPIDTVTMGLDEEESEGTRKFFGLIGPVLECLNTGRVIIVDELEAKLHPLLTRMIIRLFHSTSTNPKNAQLVFATHDANLLQYGMFRRDQIWFVEKTQQQASDLYSLAEIKLPKGSVRKDASYDKDYFRGRYGAIPFLGDFEKLFQPEK